MLNTILTDRVLWYDGESSFDPSHLIQLTSKYDVKFVTHDTDDVRAYNKFVQKSDEISVKETCKPFETTWIIPDEYKKLDVVDYLAQRHNDLTRGMCASDIEAREIRLVEEIQMYMDFDLMDVLRAIIWTINTLTTENIVWGVGRGSSVSSYVLYVIGVHDVDSHAYELDIADFLHT